jgi:HSP20 family protein
MPARDANRGRGGGRGQTRGGQGGGGRDRGASQAGGGAAAGGRRAQSQAAGRASGSAERGAAASGAQRGGGASVSGGSQRGASTAQGAGARAGAAGAGRASGGAVSGGRAGGAQSSSGSGTSAGGARVQGASATAGASATGGAGGPDVNRRDMELGDVSGGAGARGPGLGAERQLEIDTAREGETARVGSAGIGGTRGATGAGSESGQLRSAGAGAQGRTSVGSRAQGRQGVSPWFAGSENPFAMMRRMQEDLDRVFHAFGIPRFAAPVAPARELEELLARSPSLTQAAQWSPQIEVFERDDNLVVRADLPGVKREDVEVNIENDVLTIRGQRRAEHREAEGGYRRTERSYGTFFRQIPLPDGVDPSAIEASYDNGVLEVTVPTPREQPAGRRRIDIR